LEFAAKAHSKTTTHPALRNILICGSLLASIRILLIAFFSSDQNLILDLEKLVYNVHLGSAIGVREPIALLRSTLLPIELIAAERLDRCQVRRPVRRLHSMNELQFDFSCREVLSGSTRAGLWSR